MALVGGEFTERIKVYKDIWLPARTIVQKALNSRLQVSNTLNTLGGVCVVIPLLLHESKLWLQKCNVGNKN